MKYRNHPKTNARFFSFAKWLLLSAAATLAVCTMFPTLALMQNADFNDNAQTGGSNLPKTGINRT